MRLFNRGLQIVDQDRMHAPSQEDVEDGPVVPERPLLAALKHSPRGLSIVPKRENQRARVMQFVASRDQQDRRRCRSKIVHVGFLPLFPGRLGNLSRVGAAHDDFGDVRAEPLADVPEPLQSAAVFHRVVQQSGDGLVLVRAVFERQGSHPQQMGDVGNRGSLSHLSGMGCLGVGESLSETRMLLAHVHPRCTRL